MNRELGWVKIPFQVACRSGVHSNSSTSSNIPWAEIVWLAACYFSKQAFFNLCVPNKFLWIQEVPSLSRKASRAAETTRVPEQLNVSSFQFIWSYNLSGPCSTPFKTWKKSKLNFLKRWEVNDIIEKTELLNSIHLNGNASGFLPLAKHWTRALTRSGESQACRGQRIFNKKMHDPD